MRRFRFVLCGALTLALAAGGPAAAHHSLRDYDRGADSSISGVLKGFEFVNPHVWIRILVTKSDNSVEEWSFEGPGPGRLARYGWDADSFKSGDTLTVYFNPKRDGSPGGLFQSVKDSDGKEYSGGMGRRNRDARDAISDPEY